MPSRSGLAIRARQRATRSASSERHGRSRSTRAGVGPGRKGPWCRRGRWSPLSPGRLGQDLARRCSARPSSRTPEARPGRTRSVTGASRLSIRPSDVHPRGAAHRRHRDPQGWPSGELGPQRTAFFMSAAILFSLVAVNSVSAKEVGHIAPSSRFAMSLNPNVAYLELNFAALVK